MYKFEHDGAEFEIPAFAEIPIGVIRKSRRAADEMDKAFLILEELMGEDSPELAAVDSMNADQFQVFLTGWTQGGTPGESSSSSN